MQVPITLNRNSLMAQSIKPYAMLLVLILLLFVSTSVLVGIANARPPFLLTEQLKPEDRTWEKKPLTSTLQMVKVLLWGKSQTPVPAPVRATSFCTINIHLSLIL